MHNSDNEELYKRSKLNDNNTVGKIFDKVQLTKLLIHTLKELGYNESALTLQDESGGIQVESSIVQKLFNFIKLGKYEVVTFDLLTNLSLKFHGEEAIITKFPTTKKHEKNGNSMKIDNILSSDSMEISKMMTNFTLQFDTFNTFYENNIFNSNDLNYFKNILEIMILINKQFFIELIYNKKALSTAVIFLRNTLRKYINLWDTILSSLQTNIIDEEVIFTPEKLIRELSSLLTNPWDTQNNLWKGSLSKSRSDLINRVSNYINPDDLVPKGRLITLLRQSINYQRSQDTSTLFDDEIDTDMDNDEYTTINLLQDNISDFERINFVEEKVIADNQDEIWYLQFSPDGKYLACATADSIMDRKIIIYDVANDFKIYKILEGNSQCVLYLSFSPDGRYLVSCPFNENTNIYDMQAKGRKIKYEKEDDDARDEDDILNESENEKEEAVTEIIKPFVFFEVLPSLSSILQSAPSSSRRNTHTTAEGTSPASASSPESAPMSSPTSSSSAGGSSPIQADSNIANQNNSSLRVWCCDWFHTEKHSGKFIIGSPDRDVMIYDIKSRSVIYRFSENFKKILSKGDSVVSSRLDGDSGNVIPNHDSVGKYSDILADELFPRIHDIKISNDDNFVLLMTHQGTIDVYDISNLPGGNSDSKNVQHTYCKIVQRLNIGKNLTCLSLPQATGDTFKSLRPLVLVNLQHNELQLWDYQENILIQKFFGQKQEQFIIRSCFGFDNKLIVSGSEDGKIYIWDRVKGNIVGVLTGHINGKSTVTGLGTSKKFGKNCNVVTWNPANKTMFASGGDDGLIKIWRVIKN